MFTHPGMRIQQRARAALMEELGGFWSMALHKEPFRGSPAGRFSATPQNGRAAELSRPAPESASGHAGSEACTEKGKPRSTAVLLALPASARGYGSGIATSSNEVHI